MLNFQNSPFSDRPTETSESARAKPTDESEQTVFLVDDDDNVRNSLTFFLEGYHLKVQTFSNGHEFLEKVDPQADGCLILDIRMPGLSGMEVQMRLKQMHASFPIIVLTAHADVPVAVESIKQGAYDFLLKSSSQHEIISTVQEALKHSRRNREVIRELNRTRALMQSLSKRELEVVDLVIEGLTSREISERLDIKIKTVDAHRANLMRKMGAANVADLINKIVTLRNTDHPKQS